MKIVAEPGSVTHEFACHSKACAPPPVGAGGSGSGKGSSKGGGGVPAVNKPQRIVKMSRGHAAGVATRAKAGSRPGAGGAVRSQVKPHSTPNFIDTGAARHFQGGSMPSTLQGVKKHGWGSASRIGPGVRDGHRHAAGDLGHAKAFIKKMKDKYKNWAKH